MSGLFKKPQKQKQLSLQEQMDALEEKDGDTSTSESLTESFTTMVDLNKNAKPVPVYKTREG